jgi:signal peptidase II
MVMARFESLPNAPVVAEAENFSASALKRFGGLILLLWALDLLIKWWVTQHFNYGERVNLLPFFDLVLAHNTGAAFSFLANQSGWQRWVLAAIAIGISGWLVAWLKRTPRTYSVLGLSLSLVLAGALGNLTDRLVNGYVVDYILVYYPPYYFPAFNLADSVIFLGVVGLFIDFWHTNKLEKQAKQQKDMKT